jgi:hypothetical protein
LREPLVAWASRPCNISVAVHGSRFTVHGFQDILSAFLASFRPSRHASISSKRSIFMSDSFFSTVNREP